MAFQECPVTSPADNPYHRQNIVKPEEESISMIPQNTVKLEGKEAERMLRLMDALDDLDDVQKVYANFDIPDNLLEAAA